MQSFNRFLIIALVVILSGFAVDYVLFAPDDTTFERRSALYEELQSKKKEASGCLAIPDNEETSRGIVGSIIYDHTYDPDKPLEERYGLSIEKRQNLELSILEELKEKCDKTITDYRRKYAEIEKLNEEVALWMSPMYYRIFVQKPQESTTEDITNNSFNINSYHFEKFENTEKIVEKAVLDKLSEH